MDLSPVGEGPLESPRLGAESRALAQGARAGGVAVVSLALVLIGGGFRNGFEAAVVRGQCSSQHGRPVRRELREIRAQFAR